MMFCRKCGAHNEDNSFKCVKCGNLLHDVPQTKIIVADNLAVMIPVKNPNSLWSYYLGLLSLFPILGLPIGIIAFILGVNALKFAGRNPEAKGKIHAWVGILVSAFSTLIINIPLILVFFISAFLKH